MINAILMLLVAGTITFFMQNQAPVTITFLDWTFESSSGAVEVVAMLAGVVLMQLVSVIRKRQADAARRLESLNRRHRW